MKSIGLINIAAYAYAYAYAYIYASTGLSIFAFMLRQACHKLLHCKCVYLMLRHYLSITDNACQSDMGVVSELPVSDKDKSVNYRCLTLPVSAVN